MRTASIALLAACILAPALTATDASGQDVERLGRMHGVRPPDDYYATRRGNPRAFEFRNAWFRRARAVFAERERLLRQADMTRLNSHFAGGAASQAMASRAGVAVTGTFSIPVLLGGFSNNTSTAFDSTDYDSKLFSTSAAPPYSTTTYYDELSRGLVTMTGDVFGWFAADSADTYYEGSSNCLGTGSSKCGEFLTELFVHYDSIVDFSLYDNDGPDGMPDSGDDDGIVDFVAVIHPEVGGECGGSNIWSHRWVYRAWPASGGAPFTTDDPRSGGGNIVIDDYIIQGGEGGPTICSPGLIMPIGVFTHEAGHALGIPDLYDTSVGSFGVGNWDLMATGGTDAESPAHMSAWPLQQLGWISVDTILGTSGFRSFDIDPIQSSDTVFALCTAAAPGDCFNEEHFMLENRQALGADATSLPSTGLLIWHVDPSRIGDCSAPGTPCSLNTVNQEPDPGYDLEEADGLRDLNNHVNNGDTGDPFPGSSGNTTFGTLTNPSAAFNDSTPSNIVVDSIAQNPDMSVHVAVNFSTVQELITTNVPGTDVKVDGQSFPAPHQPIWVVGEDHTIAVDSIQTTAPGTRHIFGSWSDGGARSHMVTAQSTPDTFSAALDTEHQLSATISGTGGGTIQSTIPLDSGGSAWIGDGLLDTLVAMPDTASTFLGWEGDTTSTFETLILTMDKPFTVQAVMGLPVAITSDSALAGGVMGAAYADTLQASGGSGSYVWTVISGAPPTGVQLDTLTGILSGVPEESGDFDLTVRAQSVSLTADQAFGMTVTKPTLTLDMVVDQLLAGEDALSDEELQFLDLIGNANGRFDIGDLRAWLIDSGQL